MTTIKANMIITTSKGLEMTVESVNGRGDAIMSWKTEDGIQKSQFKASIIEASFESGHFTEKKAAKGDNMEMTFKQESTIPAFKGKTQKTFIINATNTLCEPGQYMVTIIDDKHILEVLVKRNKGFSKLNENAHYLTCNRLGAYVKEHSKDF